MTLLRSRPARHRQPPRWMPTPPMQEPVRTADHGPGAEFRPWRPTRRLRALLVANFGVATFYLAWWLAPGHTGTPVLFWLLAGAEAFNAMHLLGLWWAIWATRVDPPPQIETQFSVDVFIATCGEPLHVIARTVKAAVEMDYPHRTVVCDDGADPEVRALAERLGAEYIARTSRKGAKAGNLNNALRNTDGELFAIFDADHVPRRDFLRRILGYFGDPTLAFVQTPQYYGNSTQNEVARGAYQQQAIFYGPIMRGKNGLHSAFCCGTNAVFRRAALEEVGGFDEKSVVEDFVTSMRIHRRGWRSVYYPYILAEGLGPSTLRSYFRQQFRWARGSVGALFSGEPLKPGFTLGQRVQYLLATTYYLIGMVTMAYLLLPILYLFGGWSPFSLGSGSFLLFYGPYIVLGLVTIRWGLGNQLRLEHLRYTYGTFPVYAFAALAALLHLPARFRVTSKRANERHRPPLLAGVAVLFYAATIAAIVVGLFLRPFGARTVTNISWGVVNLLLLNGIVGVAFRELLALKRPARAAMRATIRTARALRPISGGAPPPPAAAAAEAGLTLPRGNRFILPEYAVPPELQAPVTTSFRMGLWVAALTALGFTLRMALINVQSLRLDEALSLNQVQNHSLVGLWQYLVHGNVHVPLYHTILHFWVQIAGTSEWAIRIPSVVFGTAAIPLMYVVGKRLIGPRAAVFAAAIGAFSPFWVWHSDEARMYPLLLMLVLASMALLFEALEKGKAWRWVAYGAVTALSLYSHYFALLMPPVHMAYLLINRVGKRKILAFMATMAGVGATFLPWVLWLYTSRIAHEGVGSLTNNLRLDQPETALSVVYGFLIFFIVYLIGYHPPAVFTMISALVVGSWPLAAQFTIVSRRMFSWLRSRATLFMLTWITFTVGVVFVLNIWKSGLWYQKYLILASPAVFYFAARGFARVAGRRNISLALLVVPLAAGSVWTNFESNNPVREDYRDAAATVRAASGPYDPVLVLPGFDTAPFRYYFDSPGGVYGWDKPTDVMIHKLIPRVVRTHQGASMWVVADRLLQEDTDQKIDPRIPSYIERSYIRTARCSFGRIDVRRYLLQSRDAVLGAQLREASPVLCGALGLVAGSTAAFNRGLAWFLVAFNLLFVLGVVVTYLLRRRRETGGGKHGPEPTRAVPDEEPMAESWAPEIPVVQSNPGHAPATATVPMPTADVPVPANASAPEAVAEAPAPRPAPKAPDTKADYIARLQDPDPFLRISAIAALKGQPDCDTYLVRALKDEYPLVRREAVRALREIGSTLATEALIEVAGHDPSAEVREEAVAGLGALVRERRTPQV